MQKNVASQKWVVFAFEDEGGSNPGEPVTGDAANITANVRIDGGAANAVDDTNPTELEDGYYIFDITAAESNGECILITPASSTANVNVIGVPGVVYTTPPNFPDTTIAATTGLVDVGLNDAHSEPTGVPAANETPLDKLGYLFMALRNKVTVTSSKKQFFDDGGTAEWEKDLSDDGTTYTETEGNAP